MPEPVYPAAFDGKCARKTCGNPHDNCKHTDYLGRLYCRSCAMAINRANPSDPELVTIPRDVVKKD